MNNIQIFEYNGTPITFNNGDTRMVNATEMAKVFGKTAKDWLRTNAAQDFINEYSSVRQICPSQLVQVLRGNSNLFEQGTWMHEDVAIEFARWLNPKFAIWCNDRIKELMTHGITATPQTIESIIENPKNVITILENLVKEREEKEKALIQVREQNKMIAVLEDKVKEDKPKVTFVNNLLDSGAYINIKQLASYLIQNNYKCLNINGRKVKMGHLKLLEWMRVNRYLGSSCDNWNLANQKYIEKGYFILKPSYHDENGRLVYSQSTKVLWKGAMYFANMFLGNAPKMNDLFIAAQSTRDEY